MSALSRQIFSYHLRRKKIWLLAGLTVLVAAVAIITSFYPRPIEFIAQNPIFEALIANYWQDGATGEVISQFIYQFNRRIFHYTAFFIALFTVVGSPLDDKSILKPIAGTLTGRANLLVAEITASLSAIYFFTVGMFIFVQIGALSTGTVAIHQFLTLPVILLKLTFFALLYFLFRQLTGFLPATVGSSLIYLLAHLRSAFGRLSHLNGGISRLAGRGLYIFLPPFDYFITSSADGAGTYLLGALHIFIRLCWIFLIGSGLFLVNHKYDLL